MHLTRTSNVAIIGLIGLIGVIVLLASASAGLSFT